MTCRSLQVVVGGGPTGVEYAGELHDFLKEDLANVRSRRFFCSILVADTPSIQWYPDLADRINITLIEALPNVLPMFSKQLMCVRVDWAFRSGLCSHRRSFSDYTMSTFKENKIDIKTKTMVKEVQEKKILAMNENKEVVEYPYGLLVWSAPFPRSHD